MDNWTKVKEGTTTILLYKDADSIYDASVFYNPKMVINRDITLLTVLSLGKRKIKKFKFLDPFAGSGIRSFRLLSELPRDLIDKVYISDINLAAVRNIERNICKMKLGNRVDTKRVDAFISIVDHLKKGNLVDIIDLDPFGSPIAFIEVAIRALEKTEGYLFLTATDMQVLCGKVANACLRLYNATPTRSFLTHEVALRILFYNLIISAGRIGVEIKPLISFQYEHFFRIHVQVVKGKNKANKQHTNIGNLYLCEQCVYFHTSKIEEVNEITNCPVCGKKLTKIGPMWLGELQNEEIIDEMLEDINELELPSKQQTAKVLMKLKEEIDMPPMFYFLPFLYKKYKKDAAPIETIIEKIKEKGYGATRTLFNPQSIKSTAPYDVIHDIVKAL